MADVAELEADLLEDYVTTAAAALYFYDKLLVGHREVDLIWGRKSIGLVVPAIYGAMHICTAFYIFMAFCPPPDASCRSVLGMNIAVVTMWCLLYLSWGTASALRAYAINGRRLLLPILVFVLGALLPVITNVYSATFLVLTSLPAGAGCDAESSTPANISNITRFMLFRTRNENTSLVQVEIITRAGISLSDALVLYATWRATGGTKLLARRLDMEVSLSSLVLTDGTIYFCIVLIANITVLALYIQSPLGTGDQGEATILTAVLTTICLSRLLLNLRDVALGSEVRSAASASQESELSTVKFSRSRVLGPLGNSVDDGLSYYDADADPGDGECSGVSAGSTPAANEVEVEVEESSERPSGF